MILSTLEIKKFWGAIKAIGVGGKSIDKCSCAHYHEWLGNFVHGEEGRAINNLESG